MKELARKFLNEYRPRLRTVLFLFAAAAGFGVITAYYQPQLMERILASFAERFGEGPALDAHLAMEIFRQNVTVSLVAWLGGLAFAVPSVFVVLSNGFVMGYVVSYLVLALSDAGQSLVVLLAGLLPHAVLELPAFLAAAALGLALGLDWLKVENRGKRLRVLGRSFKHTVKYFAIIVLLLFAAAWIEVFISGRLVNNF